MKNAQFRNVFLFILAIIFSVFIFHAQNSFAAIKSTSSLESLKTQANTVTNNEITQLNSVKQRISTDKRLSAQQQTRLEANVQQLVALLTNAQARIQAAQNNAEVMDAFSATVKTTTQGVSNIVRAETNVTDGLQGFLYQAQTNNVNTNKLQVNLDKMHATANAIKALSDDDDKVIAQNPGGAGGEQEKDNDADDGGKNGGGNNQGNNQGNNAGNIDIGQLAAQFQQMLTQLINNLQQQQNGGGDLANLLQQLQTLVNQVLQQNPGLQNPPVQNPQPTNTPIVAQPPTDTPIAIQQPTDTPIPTPTQANCMTRQQVAQAATTLNVCLFILNNEVYKKGTVNSPHQGHTCGTDVTSIIPSFHAASADIYLTPNHYSTICP